MASAEEVIPNLNAPHAPTERAIEAFTAVQGEIAKAIRASRKLWADEPRMWSRAAGVENLMDNKFSIVDNLVEIRSAPVSYGTIILGKLRIPAVNDEEGEGFIHVRIHDPPGEGTRNVIFHSIWTDEGNKDANGQATTWRAIQTRDTPLEFFHE